MEKTLIQNVAGPGILDNRYYAVFIFIKKINKKTFKILLVCFFFLLFLSLSLFFKDEMEFSDLQMMQNMVLLIYYYFFFLGT